MRNSPELPDTIAKNGCLVFFRAVALLLIVLICSSSSSAYSVLTHEAIVDLLWTDEIRPLLLKRFPGLSEDKITEAHAYAYGGAVIQDLGYYPFGSREFSDMVKPGFATRILSTLLRFTPKIGPFKGLAFNNPTPRTEDLYIKSINKTVDQYKAFLEAVRTNTLVLPNCDFDTGQPTKAAEYSLTDDAYAKLLDRLSERKFDRTSPDLRENILQFYSDLSAPIETKNDGSRWQSVLASLDQLKLMTPNASAESPSSRIPVLLTIPTDKSTNHPQRK